MRVYAFEGIHYSGTPDEAGALVAPPYDQINDALRDRLHAAAPHQFAHLIKPVTGEPGEATTPYVKAARLHQAWLGDGTLVVDSAPALYPYEIVLAGGGVRLGLTALVGFENPKSGIIRAHEQTLEKPLADRLELLRETKVDFEPVLLLPDDGGRLDAMLAEDIQGKTPLADHLDADGHHHRIFRVDDAARIGEYKTLLADLPAAIADGHHRYKTGALYASETKAKAGTAAAAKLAVITSLSAPSLAIEPIHRALADPHEKYDLKRLHSTLRSRRTSSAKDGAALAAEVAAAEQPALGVWMRGGAGPEIWQLDAASAPKSRTESAAHLTVVLLAEALLPGLELEPSASLDGTVIYRSDPTELHRMVTSGEVRIAFFIPPMTPAEFSAAIANGDLLPPKSTRFLPKVFSGLVWAAHSSRLA
ncbi:MAG: DUF1015 domain-containing protein [Acidobacteriota bacterium]